MWNNIPIFQGFLQSVGGSGELDNLSEQAKQILFVSQQLINIFVHLKCKFAKQAVINTKIILAQAIYMASNSLVRIVSPRNGTIFGVQMGLPLILRPELHHLVSSTDLKNET